MAVSNKLNFNPDEFDALIEEALRSEPMRQVPPGMYRDIRARLRIAAMVQEERRRFKRSLLLGSTGIAGLAAFSILMAQILDASRVASGVMAGGLGMYDSMTATMGLEWNALTLLLFAGSACLAVLSAMSISQGDHVGQLAQSAVSRSLTRFLHRGHAA